MAGLYLFNFYFGVIQCYVFNEEGWFKLYVWDVRYVYYDKSVNVFWLAIVGWGLICWDCSINELEFIFFKGEKSLVLYSVYVDVDGIFWLLSE